MWPIWLVWWWLWQRLARGFFLLSDLNGSLGSQPWSQPCMGLFFHGSFRNGSDRPLVHSELFFFFFFFYEFMHIWPGGKPWIHFGTGPTFLVYYFRFTDYDYSKFQNMGRCLYHNEQLAVSNSELNVGGDGAYLSNVLSLEPEGDVVYPGGSMPILNTTTVAVASCSSLCEGSIMLKCWWGFWYYTFIRMQQLE